MLNVFQISGGDGHNDFFFYDLLICSPAEGDNDFEVGALSFGK
jgi:hypothetical protein